MSELIKCPICGATEVVLLDNKTNKFKCRACLNEFSPRQKNGIEEEKPSQNSNNRKVFFDRLMGKVVELHSYFDNKIVAGTGFFITGEYILTNAHVIIENMDDSQSMANMAIQIMGNNYSKNKQFIFEVVSADREKDIALLKLDQGHNDYAKFTTNMYNGEQVFAIGNSRGEGLCIVEGIISDTDRKVNGQDLFMTSALVTNGNSGCPIFNNEGQILGMITEGSPSSVAMNYAIPSKVLMDYIKKVEEDEQISVL